MGLIARKPGVTVSVTGALVVPFAEAVICVVPGSKPIARPLPALIVATLGALLTQLKVAPMMMLPLLSCATAVICSVPLTAIADGIEVIVTVGTPVPAEPPAPHPDRMWAANRSATSRNTLCGIFDKPPSGRVHYSTRDKQKIETLMYQ
jgi:hypothetical protein